MHKRGLSRVKGLMMTKDSGVATPWYLSGGIASASCVAAYSPYGAVDLADSYINEANPGTYNAAAGTAPDWDAVNGWKFTAASSHWLETGIVPATGWTILVKFSNVPSGDHVSIGCGEGVAGVFIEHKTSANQQIVNAGQYYIHSTVETDGVIGYSNKTQYLDGIPVGTMAAGAVTSLLSLNIGRLKRASPVLYFSGYIQKIAIYNTVLTDAQMKAVTLAMGGEIGVSGADFWDNNYTTVTARAAGGGSYIRTSPGARLVYTTEATSMILDTYNDIYSTYPGFCEIGVRINGVESAVDPTAMYSQFHTVALGDGAKTVEIIAGLQSGAAQATRTGTYVNWVTFNGPATKVSQVTSPRIVVYGDSITVGANATNPTLQGWARLLSVAYSGSVVQEARGNRSLYEDCVDEAARVTFAALLAALNPSIIWLAIGTNDYGLSKWSHENFGIAYADLLVKINAAIPGATIYCQTPISRSGGGDLGGGLGTLAEYRTEIANAAAGKAYCVLVDGTDAAFPQVGDLDDGVHPTTDGQAMYADAVKAILGIA